MPELDALNLIIYKTLEKGLKVKDLQPKIGSQDHVSAFLSEKREITMKMAQILKNYCSIPVEGFLHNA